MKPFSGLGIGLSLLFGCLLLALVAELYYLLWWKKRTINREDVEGNDNYSKSYAKKFLDLICWKKPSSLQRNNSSIEESGEDPIQVEPQEADLELGTSKELLVKTLGSEESVEAELMRLHNLSGPPRFLFTIKEETKEDLESEDGKSRGDKSRKGSRTRSLSDIILTLETPNFHTPLASPRLKSRNLSNTNMEPYHHLGINPLFESSVEVELNRLRSSPPPKFKFLRDAEEKLIRRLLEEAEKRASKSCGPLQESGVKPFNSVVGSEEIEGSFLGFIVGLKNKEGEVVHNLPQCPSSSSQVLPLASSPTMFRTALDRKPLGN